MQIKKGSPLNPLQPLVLDGAGVPRFKENAIVTYILDRAREVGCDLNHLAGREFSQDDREQFAQLIGYSLGGLSELSYVSGVTLKEAEAMPVYNGADTLVVRTHRAATRHLQEYIERDLSGLADECRNLAGVIEKSRKCPKCGGVGVGE